MPNLKFSQFQEKTDPANVQFVVGYNGTDNVRIAPGNISGGAAYPFLIDTHYTLVLYLQVYLAIHKEIQF
jgi:hypothetical protein